MSLRNKTLRLAIGGWTYKSIPNHLKSNTEIGFQLRKIETVGVAVLSWDSLSDLWKMTGENCFG